MCDRHTLTLKLTFFLIPSCEEDINECETESPCKNGGVCVNSPGTFSCECTEQFIGDHCEKFKLITCDNEPCKAPSTCKDVVNPTNGDNFTCVCESGYVGNLCEALFCERKPCMNNGTCTVIEQVSS